MKMVKSSADVVSIKDPFMKIETVGRTCYKSSSDMTLDTAKAFYSRLVKSGHYAMLEHTTFCFEVSESTFYSLVGHKFLNYSVEEFEHKPFARYLISGNLRAINEIEEVELLSALYLLDPMLVYLKSFNPATVRHFNENNVKFADVDNIADIQDHAYQAHKYVTFHFICDRGVSHEIVRHRPASYAQESTRYCNYAKDKFGNEITVIEPHDYESWQSLVQSHFKQTIEQCEGTYNYMIAEGMTPQQARAILPNALKTEVIMTANCNEYNHFFNLRSKGTTGAPHPDMKELADKALSLYTQENRFYK